MTSSQQAAWPRPLSAFMSPSDKRPPVIMFLWPRALLAPLGAVFRRAPLLGLQTQNINTTGVKFHYAGFETCFAPQHPWVLGAKRISNRDHGTILIQARDVIHNVRCTGLLFVRAGDSMRLKLVVEAAIAREGSSLFFNTMNTVMPTATTMMTAKRMPTIAPAQPHRDGQIRHEQWWYPYCSTNSVHIEGAWCEGGTGSR